MQAIPTEYKGIRLKSRLEADTAFLLDELLGLKWEYEPRSFLLPDGTHYMPDFYCPDPGLWVECRGVSYDKGDRQIEQFGRWCETRGGPFSDGGAYAVFGPGDGPMRWWLAGVEGTQLADVAPCAACDGWSLVAWSDGMVKPSLCGHGPAGDWSLTPGMADGRLVLVPQSVGALTMSVRDFVAAAIRRERRKRIGVYLAGKIANHPWRYDIVPNLSGPRLSFETRDHEQVPMLYGRPPQWDVFEYVGPYFVEDCGHGGGVGTGCGFGENNHGSAEWCIGVNHSRQSMVIDLCRHWIDRSDALFVWLDRRDAFGTLVEIGYAAALKKPIYVYEPDGELRGLEEMEAIVRRCHPHCTWADQNEIADEREHHDDLWFARKIATHHAYVADVSAAWSDFARRVIFDIPDTPERTYATATGRHFLGTVDV